ncbi:MAG: hypothetical protein HONBIEJF_00453 [Fimbriimonadaceae bacterium]|nr:hypothetical protein [Fimbriimonadaceae bacterium]
MKSKTVEQTRVEMSQVMTPNDANFLGKVFGGSILSMIDLVAYTTASKFAGNVCVTASFDHVDFHVPIEVGDLVSMIGHVSYAGRTSVEITIEIFAENVLSSERRHTNTARVTMVAIHDGKPTPVPQLICNTREERLRFLSAKVRRELRGKQLAELERIHAEYAQKTDEELAELMSLPRLGV